MNLAHAADLAFAAASPPGGAGGSSALVTQVMRIGVHILFARALGIHVEAAYFFLFVPLLAVIVSLPISLNGIGVREGAGILLPPAEDPRRPRRSTE